MDASTVDLVLRVELAGARYALPLANVDEVLQAAAPTPVPGAPAMVDGVLDVRGAVLPVIDLRCRFGLQTRPVRSTDHFVVARAAGRRLVLRVDQALDLVPLPPEQVTAAAELRVGGARVVGVARMADGLVLVHDLATLLDAEEAAAVDAVTR